MITLFPSRCYNGGKQHRFEARVTEDRFPPTTEGIEMHGRNIADSIVQILEAGTRTKQTYHGDVCCWCGAVVNKPTKET